MRTAYIGLGSNLGDRAGNVRSAAEKLKNHAVDGQLRLSPLYLSEPWGKLDQPDFVNAAAEIATQLSPEDLLATCLSIEQGMGRERGEKWGPRIIDLDIVFYGDEIVNTQDLEIPHPRLAERAFVLQPLLDLCPELVDPRTGRPLADLLSGLARQPGDLVRIGR
jgi:2-amino-4-hydroxy-6-hydroxymethyldihydropteridine diphosphokinase